MAELDFERLKRMVEMSAELTSAARAESERCRDYYDGHQWTANEVATLQRRKQPVITINRIQRKIDAMVGIEQRSRTDPRAYPRNPQDEDAADIATKALVFVDEATRFDAHRSGAFENMVIEGYGGVEIVAEEVGGRFDIKVNRLRWEEIFFDPHSREKDFSDATYIGAVKWLSLDQALELYEDSYKPKNKGETLEEVLRGSFLSLDGDTFEDRPLNNGSTYRWGDKRRDRVRVAQMYYRRKGVWYLAILTGGGEIFNGPSPYLDERGEPECPIVLMSGYVDRENRRYGLVKSMLSAQDEINKRRSKLLHQLNSRQTAGIKGAVDVPKMKAELANPDGHVEVDPNTADMARELGIPAWQMLPTQDQIAGQFNLLVESKEEIDKLGPNASLIGELQGQQSGRAIMAQQQAGLIEIAPIYDSLRDWTLRCYRQMWHRIRQFWTDERWVRITDEMEAPQFVQVNAFRGFDPMTMQPLMENVLAEMDVDIIVSDSPDYVTLQSEQYEQLVQLVQAGIPIPPEMLIEVSSLRNKQRILEQMQQAQQAAMMQQAEAQQAAAQIEQMKLEGDMNAKQAKAQSDQAGAVLKMEQARRTALGF